MLNLSLVGVDERSAGGAEWHSLRAGLGEIYSDLAAVDGLGLQLGLGGLSAGNINKVGMGESSGLAGSPVNSNSDVSAVANTSEELVQVLVGDIEGKVSDEEGSGWSIGLAIGGTLAVWAENVLDVYASAVNDKSVHLLDGSGSSILFLELDISESFRKSTGIINNLCANNLSELAELSLQILASNAV